MTTPHPGYPINYRCYDFNQDPLFIKLTTDYPGDWTPHKQGYRVKWGKVTAYVYRTGSDEEICVEMVCLKDKYKRKANSRIYLNDAFKSCVDSIDYCLKACHDDWLSKLTVLKDCPPKIKECLSPGIIDYIEWSQDTIAQLKEQLKAEQKTIRQLNKLKGVLGL
jgi:hypothetical protein